MTKPTLEHLAAGLADGRITARHLVDECLSAIERPDGEGARAFIHVDTDQARAAADAMDKLRKAGAAPSRYAGIPLAIKDLADIQGQATRAGSRALDTPPAARDAPAVARLRQAGFILIGRTNMTEFAFSGIGINPHHGTPKSTYRRDIGHVPGGSSSGSAVAVADGMAHGALGTDTGGSCRIPAAFNGIVGYKPTARRVPLDGIVPLAPSLDSVGPLARSVACCATLDAVLSGERVAPLHPRPVAGLRLAAPTTVALDELDETVGRAFDRSLGKLSRAGASIARIEAPELEQMAVMNAKGGFPAAESYAWHRQLIAAKGDLYDPRVAARIRRGEGQSAADYIDLLQQRKAYIAGCARRFGGFDAIVLPTTAIAAPRIADLDDDGDFAKANLLVLRNCTLINLMDGCAISLPMHEDGEPPTGLMLAGIAGRDHALFEIAAGVEEALRA